jgi:hypothetical protein
MVLRSTAAFHVETAHNVGRFALGCCCHVFVQRRLIRTLSFSP